VRCSVVCCGAVLRLALETLPSAQYCFFCLISKAGIPLRRWTTCSPCVLNVHTWRPSTSTASRSRLPLVRCALWYGSAPGGCSLFVVRLILSHRAVGASPPRRPACLALDDEPRRREGTEINTSRQPASCPLIPFEQKEPDYLLWPPLRSSFASSSTPAGCLLQLKHGLDEAARGAKSG
jgi:hypothetical protein